MGMIGVGLPKWRPGSGAGPFAGPAVRATAGAVVGPQKMKGADVCGILALADPLGPGFVHETGRAVAQRAGIAAGIAANAL